MKKLLLLAILAIMSMPSFAKICKDDPRLFMIKSTIDKLDNGEEIKPVKVTAETFLRMPPLVRNKLGDNVRVYNKSCIPNQIYQGSLAKSIELPFYTIENALHYALLRDDKAMAELIVSQFQAEPMTTDKALSLVSILPWSQAAIDNLYKYNFMKKLPQENKGRTGSPQVKVCSKHIAKVSQIDLYSLISGRVSDNVITGYSAYKAILFIATKNGFTVDNYNSYLKLSSVHNKNSEKASCSGLSIARTIGSLSNAGINLYSTDTTNSKQNLKETQKLTL